MAPCGDQHLGAAVHLDSLDKRWPTRVRLRVARRQASSAVRINPGIRMRRAAKPQLRRWPPSSAGSAHLADDGRGSRQSLTGISRWSPGPAPLQAAKVDSQATSKLSSVLRSRSSALAWVAYHSRADSESRPTRGCGACRSVAPSPRGDPLEKARDRGGQQSR
jgi:hypothetical protein